MAPPNPTIHATRSSLAVLGLAVIGSLCLGCASEGSSTQSDDANAPVNVVSAELEEGTEPGSEATLDDKSKEGAALKVLVTGFNDWKELGDPPNVWRCRENPSCRLLLAGESSEKPETVEGGELVERLLAMKTSSAGRPIEWTFKTLPVTWQVSENLNLREHELVVHIGLGVYDRFDQLKLERGAYNRRRGRDAKGEQRGEKIDAAGAETKNAPESSQTDAILDALDGRKFGSYVVDVAAARPENDYLCNETHYRALSELEAARDAEARLQRVHFLHIPYAQDGDYAKLADAVGALIAALVAGDAQPVRG